MAASQLRQQPHPILKLVKKKSKQVGQFLSLVNQMVAIPLKARKMTIELASIQRKALIARSRLAKLAKINKIARRHPKFSQQHQRQPSKFLRMMKQPKQRQLTKALKTATP